MGIESFSCTVQNQTRLFSFVSLFSYSHFFADDSEKVGSNHFPGLGNFCPLILGCHPRGHVSGQVQDALDTYLMAPDCRDGLDRPENVPRARAP